MSDEIYRAPDDYIAIVGLLNEYASAIDTRNWDLLASCFTGDATADLPLTGHHRGNRDIADAIHNLVKHLDATQHMITNHVVRVINSEVHSTCYFQAQHVLAGAEGGSTFTSGGRYRDRLVKEGGLWKIRHRLLERIWTAGNSSLLPDALADHQHMTEPMG